MPVYRVNVTTTGSAGSATGTATTTLPVYGILGAIEIDYHGSAPATTDVTISESGEFGRTLLTRTNTATDGTFYPAPLITDATGTATTSYGTYILTGELISVSVAQCDALTNAVVVTIQTLK